MAVSASTPGVDIYLGPDKPNTQFPSQDDKGSNPVPIQGHNIGVQGNKILFLLELLTMRELELA